MANENGIGLADLLKQVKRELFEASLLASASSGSKGSLAPKDLPMFAFKEVELELQVAVKNEGKAGLKIYVLEIGGGANRDDVQKVKITMEPLFTKEQLLELYKNSYSQTYDENVRKAMLGLMKGSSDNDSAVF